MIRVLYLIREFLRNLRRNWITAIASVMSLLLLFLLFDLYWIAAETSNKFYSQLMSEVRVDVFLREGLEEVDALALQEQLAQRPEVLGAVYVDREQARRELARLVGTDLLIGYEEENPLPRSYVLQIDEESLNLDALKTLASELRTMTGVESVSYGVNWVEKAESTRATIFRFGLGLGIIILATALISSTNSIRLMTRVRAAGFRQILLLGGSRTFVGLPFVLEGFVLSGLAAAGSWLLIWYARDWINLTQIEIVFPITDDIVLFCVAAAVLGGVSGYIGIRKQLKV